MAAHARLKNEFTEDEKYHNLMTASNVYGAKYSLTLLIVTGFIAFLVNLSYRLNEPRHEKSCFMPYAKNKGADQPAHPRSLISAFVVRYLNSILLNPKVQDSS